MRFSGLNSFFWIGVILLGIGGYALYRGPAFMFDAGVAPQPHEAIYYIIVGIVMIFNGFIHSTPLTDEIVNEQQQGRC
jgi:hypothetical protein